MSTKIIYVNPNLIATNIMNNRGEDDKLSRSARGTKRQDLVNSIKENGVLTPITLFRPTNGIPKGKSYIAIDGHNRLDIAAELGLKSVPAYDLGNINWDKAYSMAFVNNRGSDPLKRNLTAQDQLRAVKNILRGQRKPNKDKIEYIAKQLVLANAEREGKTDQITIKLGQFEMFKRLVSNCIRIINDPWLNKMFNHKVITMQTAGKMSEFFESANISSSCKAYFKTLVQGNTVRTRDGKAGYRDYIRSISYESFASFVYELEQHKRINESIIEQAFNKTISKEYHKAPSFSRYDNWLRNRATITQAKEFYNRIGKLLKERVSKFVNA